MTITIPASELHSARDLAVFIRYDETDVRGKIFLRSDGQQRWWFATTEFFGGRVAGGADNGTYEILIPQSVLWSLEAISDRSGDVTIEFNDDGGVWVARGAMGDVWFHQDHREFPDINEFMVAEREELGVATAGREPLFTLARVALVSRVADSESRPSYWMGICPGEIQFQNEELGVPRMGFSHNCPTSGDYAVVEIDLDLVYKAITFIEDDEIEIRIPKWNEEPVVFEGGSRTAIVMAKFTPDRVLRDRVEEVITEVFGHLSAQPDLLGAYPLVRYGRDITATLDVDVEPELVRIAAVLLDKIDATPELMRELNDINSSLSLVRVVHVDGQVLAVSDHPAHTLDPHELRTTVGHITTVSTDVVPMLSLVLGGTAQPDPAEVRRNLYLGTIIEANITPTTSAVLSGPKAVKEWPFPGTAWVITGWNPQGVSLGEEGHRRVNTDIARDVVGLGGYFVRGAGWSVERDHMEESIVAWGIDREAALTIGRRAGQDAIFEIDATSVHLLGCLDDYIETWPRHEGRKRVPRD